MTDSIIREPDEFECDIYLKTELTREELLDLIRSLTGGRPHIRFSICNKVAELSVRKNNRVLNDADPENFLNWPYYLSILPVRGTDAAEYISFLAYLIVRLRQLGYGVRAACDFEDRLKLDEPGRASD